MLLTVTLAALLVLAPVEGADMYTREAASADLDVLVGSRGRDYLDARARLEAHPEVAAPLVAGRLASSPPPGPADQQRLLALLGVFGRPEDLRLFAEQLRRDVASAAPGDEVQAAAPWRDLFRNHGDASVEPLAALVADHDLPEPLRALLLGDLVAALPRSRLGEFAAMVGLGQPTLRGALRQALVRRAQASTDDRAAIVAGLDAAADAAAPAQLAALLTARALVSAGDDAFEGRLIGLAEAAASPFVVRAAAIRLLGERAERGAVRSALVRLASAHLPPEVRAAQASELVAWLAVQALPADAAAEVIERFRLRDADSPRLAALAYERGPLPTDGRWLEEGLLHPWPEVRAAALGRVAPPCAGERARRLEKYARAETDALAARAAIQALGRCGGDASYAALDHLLVDADLDPLRRADAGRQMVEAHAARGAERVADVMARTVDLGLRRRLLEHLRAATAPTPAVRASLCAAAAEERELRADVTLTLRALFPADPCDPAE